VSEAVLYRNFESKADLFREAVFEPLGTFIAEFSQRWATPLPTEARETVLREYIDGLFRLLRANGSTAMTLLPARAHEAPGIAVADGQRRVLSDIIRPLEDLTKSRMTGFGYTGVDPVLSVRASVALIMAMALFKEWLFDDQAPVTDDEIVNELHTLIMHGVAHRDEDPITGAGPVVPH
jgi:AcrR family transcriptional regulator